MAKKEFKCFYCGRISEKEVGEINRASRKGAKVYCSKICAGLAHRKHISAQEFKANKKEYDKQYRAKNKESIKQRKAKYHKCTYDPVKAAEERKLRMSRHVEYCRQPGYREYKKKYDEQYRAKKTYGEYWESFILIQRIQSEYDDKQVRQINNLHNKTLNRKREWKRTQR